MLHLIGQMKHFKIIHKGNKMKKLLLPISTLFLIVVGCDNPIRENVVELDSTELQDFSSELTSDLDLSKSSRTALNDVLNRHGHGGQHREPGFLWKIAGELANTLTEEEKVRLFEKINETNIPLFGQQKMHGGKFKGGPKGKNTFDGIIQVLTDEQKSSFKEIMTSYREKFKAIHSQVKDGTLSKEDAHTKMQTLSDAMKTEIEALLTNEQKAQIEQNMSDQKVKMEAYHDSSKSVMVDVLGMNVDQVSSFEAINTEARDAAKALFEQAKNGDLDREPLREALKNLFSVKNTKLEVLFTDGQFEIIKIHKVIELRMKKHRNSKGKKGRRRGGSKREGGRQGNN